MELIDIITIIISTIAILISIITYKQNYYINQYEFASKEKTKEDILKLLAALHLIIDKAMYNHLMSLDFDKEKEIIKDFLLSDTWVTIKYIIKDNEIQLVRITAKFMLLIYNSDLKQAGEMALILEKDINKICDENLDSIFKEKEKIKKNLRKLKFGEESEFNKEWYEKLSNIRNNNNDELCNKLLYLKYEKNIQDCNIDMFIGVMTGNTELVGNALNNGADVKITIGEVLEKYKDFL